MRMLLRALARAQRLSTSPHRLFRQKHGNKMSDRASAPEAGEPDNELSETPGAGRPLTDLELRILRAAKITSRMALGPRDRYIREIVGMSPTSYCQILNALLDLPAAWAAEPATVKRLRERRQRDRDRYR
ncbi:DUF3263 domain-containing protein [Streptomyces lavendulae]|uniref:DUF3263 domain-containing protein n=1 Tax=Streptomyces lavendulae TaxID=1914 RepID=UPI0036BE4ED5